MSFLPQDEYKCDCPICESPMKLVEPRPDQTWMPFFGCTKFPECRGIRIVMPDGNPEPDEVWYVRNKRYKLLNIDIDLNDNSIREEPY